MGSARASRHSRSGIAPRARSVSRRPFRLPRSRARPFAEADRPGSFGQDGEKRGLGPAQLFRTPAEIQPRRGIDADDIAAERSVGGEEGQDLPLRAPGLEPQGQNGFLQLLEVRPLPVLPGQADDLHGDRARAAPDLSRAEILPQGPGHGQRVDAGMRVETFILEPDEDIVEPLGNAIAGREAPLAVGGRPGPEQPAVGAEEHRRNGIVEPDDRQGEPNDDDEKAGGTEGYEPRALEDGDTYPGRLDAPSAVPETRHILSSGFTGRSRSIVLSYWHGARRRTSPRRQAPADSTGRDRRR